MTSVTLRSHRSLAGVLADAAPQARKLAARVLPLVREHVVTVSAFAAVDWGCWDAGRVPGLIVTGISALVLDWLIRG